MQPSADMCIKKIQK